MSFASTSFLHSIAWDNALSMQSSKTERILRATAIALALLLFAYQAATAFLLYEYTRWPESFAHAGFDLGNPWPTVTRVTSANALQAGLSPGDRITAVQGTPFEGRNTLRAAVDKLFPGDRIRVSVAGREAEISWQLDGQRPAAGGMLAFVAFINVFMPVLCLVTGCWTVIAKPRDPQAWLLFLMLAAFSHLPAMFADFPSSFGVWRTIFLLLHKVLNAAWPLSMLAFGWVFPRLTPAQHKIRWVFRAYVALLVAAVVLAVVRDYHELTDGAPAAATIAAIDNTFRWLAFVMMAAVSCFFALLSYKMFVLRDADSRRRMQTILWGIGVALSPLFLLIVFSLATRSDMNALLTYVIFPAMLALILFPITLAYVIVVHRAFGLGMVIRQGLRYALARRGVRLMQIVLSIAVMITAATLATTPGINRPRVVLVMSAGVASVLLLRRIAGIVAGWVDRRFFREAYDAEQLLSG
ncbi:MAG: PDZ domain-containing protein, partial [Acidobacteria bacterium]|nr:PDZ domain-containing protein [Acidobacteriota bacterium]